MFCEKVIFALVLTAIQTAIFVSCNTQNRGEWEVSDASRDTMLNAETNVSDATTMILKIEGHTDDSVKVHGMTIAGGNINKELKVDWYNSKVSVQFEAYRAKQGSLKIKFYVPASL
ncbi:MULTISPECIES: hypothetical protein [Sphingobacterium]|uniref:hypothetical protein n=1 Tax=Sphingobacterium TaxID=28453 RepID=UPI0010520818|nr:MULTISPECIES: hypothetical protein [Sphingobacterium]MCW2264044.1 hypothetical protein [Sphingobacterium kitahiroshimense]TCR14971.1 hypothetical protein EDF67_1011078 [Sphingobacterium sp. JUb78]